MGIEPPELSYFELLILDIYEFLTNASNPAIFRTTMQKGEQLVERTVFLPNIDLELLKLYPEEIELSPDEFRELVGWLGFLRDYERKLRIENG